MEVSTLNDDRVDPAARDNLAIISACENGHDLVVKMLLKTKLVNPSAQNNKCLQVACANNHEGVVRALLTDLTVNPAVDVPYQQSKTII